ncbi:hypothetical protein [Nesterenkonia aerolata]|uniref:Uncharacterized protein n=1 Tax=Nesterenkonia aerolata TaxID=3074079 RepID=A0ABU2DW00_9MICC|nr:hypothetical protein [Nesterenkonia sp. LY-0111]MDR8020470.1 hypothetical protein [Nesterenkonia sp. LY-0111]
MTTTPEDRLKNYLAQFSPEELRYIADHGPDTWTRQAAYELFQQDQLKDANVLERLKISDAYVEWAEEETHRQAADATAGATADGYIWDYWVEADMARTAEMQAEHARRFPDCDGPSCPHIRY